MASGGRPAARAAPAKGGGEQALRVRTFIRELFRTHGRGRRIYQKRSKMVPKMVQNRMQKFNKSVIAIFIIFCPILGGGRQAGWMDAWMDEWMDAWIDG